MPTGSKGLINHISNMVAPQVSGSNNNSTWKVVKTKRQLKEDKKWKYNKAFPPLPVLSSAHENNDNSDDDSTKSSKSNKAFRTPTKKPYIKIRKVTPEDNQVKIVKVKKRKRTR